MDLETKLTILADAAKYDASCASSGSRGRRAGPRGIGSTEGLGICHSYTPDGRCISLLKLLLTNYCIYDCSYCINRRSSGVRRARFTPDEVVRLTLEFYRRNYIEGLFLSSGIIRGPDYTMEQLVAVARRLRRDHEFAGYIHLKTIPNASAELIREAGRYADRLSINVELPRQRDLDALAPDKELLQITRAMAVVRDGIAAAYSPIPDADPSLPPSAPPLLREHRLYQADWLMRFYGFGARELTPAGSPDLDLEIDPKLAWALRNRERFPLDLNRADRSELLRVPGIGVRNVDRIIRMRRHRRLRVKDLARLRVALRRALPFVVLTDHSPGSQPDRLDLRRRATGREQLDLFAIRQSARTGEL